MAHRVGVRTDVQRARRTHGGNNEKTIGRVVNECHQEWDEAVNSVLFEYRSHPARNSQSPFELLYGVKPRITPAELTEFARSSAEDDRRTELLALLGPRLAQVEE